jgi:hypothetical protein
MREIRTEIEIAAPRTTVWSILTDFDHWKEWNPISQASGVASPGSKLTMTMRGCDGKAGMRYMPIITDVKAPSSLRWRAVMIAGFVFTNDRVFELEEMSSGTRLIHREEYSGMLVPVFWRKLEKGALPKLHSMNDALKKRVEKSSDSSSLSG